MWELDPLSATIRTLGDFKTGPDDNTLPNVGPTSTAVVYDLNKSMQVGGNGYNDGVRTAPSKMASLFDITDIDNVIVHDVAPMEFRRQWANAGVSFHGKVFVVGGSAFNGDIEDGAGVLEAEIWDFATELWTTVASAMRYRLYHSTVALLGNGVMLSSGGGIPGPVRNYDSEVYYPPYLFTKQSGKTVLTPRPKILSASSINLDYGNVVNLQVFLAGSAITEVSLTGFPVSTRSFDSNMRRLRLHFTTTTDGVDVTIPASPNMATPGYYYLSVTDDAEGAKQPAMKMWHTLLSPVLDQFVRSSQGDVDLPFWDKVCSYHGGGSGPSYLSGWVTVFGCFQVTVNGRAAIPRTIGSVETRKAEEAHSNWPGVLRLQHAGHLPKPRTSLPVWYDCG